jgi:hypothetical protein
MVTIVDPQLRVETLDGHPGERRLVVSYSLHVPPFDPDLGATLLEDVVVTASDEHDAPVSPKPLEVHLRGEVVAQPGATPRLLTTDVHRADLDVEQDWWRVNEGGGFDPIAEFVDHLVARVTLRVGDLVVATATSPPITGSWGALGDD